MRPLRPGWTRRWPEGYLGPAGQVITNARGRRGWTILVSYRGDTISTRCPLSLEQAQVKAEQLHAEMRQEHHDDE